MDPIPHLSLPLRISEGAYASVQQDTLDELVTAVQCVCAFPIGFRVELPEFGIPEYELSDLPLPVDDLERIIETWEPRADVEVSEADHDPTDPLAARLQVQVTMPNEEE
jgi:hypothetical protein